MFDLLFTNESDMRRHHCAPFLAERQSYLRKRYDEGASIRFLKGLANLLLVIIERLSLKEGYSSEVPLERIVEADKEWQSLDKDTKRHQYVPVAFHDNFLGAAKRWLTYLGLLDHRYCQEDNLISRIFPRGFFRVRHIVSPMFNERLDYLEAQEKLGIPDVTLRRIAQYQLTAIELLDLHPTSRITKDDIVRAATIWKDTEIKNHRKKPGTERSHSTFILLTTRWLSFMGLLEPEEDPGFFEKEKVLSYLDWLTESRGCSLKTRKSRLSMLRKLMHYLSESGMRLADLKPEDIDGYLRLCHSNGHCRRTIAGTVSVLRCFFRYASGKQWAPPKLWMSLSAPRMYRMENVPSYLHWDDVSAILSETGQLTTAPGIRNHAILSLLAMYGLRSSEVAELKLKDIDWRNGTIHLRRAKGCRPQLMPLLDEVAQPLLKYILDVRPKQPRREEVFLTVRAPFHGICTSTVYQVASNSLHGRNLNIRHHGPHSYRHSCATKLVNEGLSLKEVADVLGHAKIDTTAIYAKVNFARLREVSDMCWKEVLDI